MGLVVYVDDVYMVVLLIDDGSNVVLYLDVLLLDVMLCDG